MFSKAPAGGFPISATGAKHTPFSLIGSDVVIVGNVSATVDLHIDGRIEGDVACAGLVQGQDSVVRGNVVAKAARIAGTIEGSLTADELIVEKSARITGDTIYGTMSIEGGAQVDGRFTPRSAIGIEEPQIKVVTLGE
jgi:cytoskeletal protein CcmA (bactofilin family)